MIEYIILHIDKEKKNDEVKKNEKNYEVKKEIGRTMDKVIQQYRNEFEMVYLRRVSKISSIQSVDIDLHIFSLVIFCLLKKIHFPRPLK